MRPPTWAARGPTSPVGGTKLVHPAAHVGKLGAPHRFLCWVRRRHPPPSGRSSPTDGGTPRTPAACQACDRALLPTRLGGTTATTAATTTRRVTITRANSRPLAVDGTEVTRRRARRMEMPARWTDNHARHLRAGGRCGALLGVPPGSPSAWRVAHLYVPAPRTRGVHPRAVTLAVSLLRLASCLYVPAPRVPQCAARRDVAAFVTSCILPVCNP